MNRFIIGQYEGFDYHKYRRDFHQGFYGIEACLFSQEQDIANLVAEAEQENFQIGVHFPLRAGKYILRDALFLSQDRTARLEAYNSVQRELEFLATINPSYVLFHYPKPVILDDRVDWSKWRFDDRREYEYESSYSLPEFEQASEQLFAWLSQQGRAYQFTPILELDAINQYIYNDSFLERLLEKYSNVRLCLDTVRLYQQHRLDPFFDAASVIKKYAKYAYSIHLSTVQITDDLVFKNNRYPVLPSQDPSEGWAPIEEYLNIIATENKNVKIVFEHKSHLVSDEELLTCYDWVDSFFK